MGYLGIYGVKIEEAGIWKVIKEKGILNFPIFYAMCVLWASDPYRELQNFQCPCVRLGSDLRVGWIDVDDFIEFDAASRCTSLQNLNI